MYKEGNREKFIKTNSQSYEAFRGLGNIFVVELPGWKLKESQLLCFLLKGNSDCPQINIILFVRVNDGEERLNERMMVWLLGNLTDILVIKL